MGDTQKKEEIPAPSSEELKEEEEALKESKDEEIRSQIVEKYGLDEDLNGETIDKLVEDFKEQRKIFGKAIRQKRDWREKAVSLSQKPKEEPKNPPKEDKSSDKLSQSVRTLRKISLSESCS